MRDGAFQTMVQVLYPPRCTICGAAVATDFGLCGPCWRDTPFISGLVCDACGVPLPGRDADAVEYCDDCLHTARPWSRGRAAMRYHENGRKLVLALKHGDRHEVVHLAAQWMARAAAPLVAPDMLIAPVPLHWLRLLHRRFNQSALLAQAVARQLGLPVCPDLLTRAKRTQSLKGLGVEARHAMLQDAIRITARHRARVAGRSILLVDDVMTSGATLSAAAQACFAAGAADVRILTLARAAKDA